MLRDAAEEFPSNVYLLVRLGYALNMQGWKLYGCRMYMEADSNYSMFDTNKNSENTEWMEAIQIFERILNTPSLLAELPIADHEVVLHILMSQYSIVGMAQRGIELALKQPSVRCSREVLLGTIAIGEENYHYIAEEINILAELLLNSIHTAITTNRTFFNDDHKKALAEFTESCKQWSELLTDARG